ncbi:unnamed protein product, partial [Boreogadus saida]
MLESTFYQEVYKCGIPVMLAKRVRASEECRKKAWGFQTSDSEGWRPRNLEHTIRGE